MKAKKNITVTIGIPTYNEYPNIVPLVKSLFEQKTDVLIERILISDDASTDEGVVELRKVKDGNLSIMENKTRRGTAVRQNQLFRQTDSDIFLLLNGDIVINDKEFINKIISPIIEGNTDLVSANVAETAPKKFIEKVLYASMHCKKEVFERLNNGHNVYNCHGVARAFSKKLYKSLVFPYAIGEDAYSYFFCVKNNFVFTFLSNVSVSYRLPTRYYDHKKQSKRFLYSIEKLKKSFGTKFVADSYKIPLFLAITAGMKYLFRYPIYFISYCFISCYVRVHDSRETASQDTWDIAVSSKVLSANI